MVERIKAFTQSDMMVIYKAIIGTSVLIGIMFIGGLLVEMRDNDKALLIAVQELSKANVGINKDILYNRRDIAELARSHVKTKEDVDKIKLRLQLQ